MEEGVGDDGLEDALLVDEVAAVRAGFDDVDEVDAGDLGDGFGGELDYGEGARGGVGGDAEIES